jgi:enoyl-CoA hydratase/carnithine racemase
MGALQNEVQSVLDAQQVKVSIEDQIAVVTLNRPASRNAMTLSMWRTMPAILSTLEGDANVRAVILTGAGADFCAGADIPEFDQVRADPNSHWLMKPPLTPVATQLPINKPMIAVLRGYCLGAGHIWPCLAIFATPRAMRFSGSCCQALHHLWCQRNPETFGAGGPIPRKKNPLQRRTL